MEVSFVKDPKTSPPDPNQPYICVAGPDGKEQWILLATDAGDGVTDADFDFEGTKAKLEAEESIFE